ncbi:hypothetical protein ACQEU5_20140 [Marinactinospora thermotolerans]|uniref:Uncharacterized protein n=1 Tax=Marinactinospora thermotolerans DSM 45154 TaxID=1122192 RepID=A0A1T4PWD5_9ACTN|nr:hypothetical protein [Marinactinospora thermotolerans]SJZ95802.1 hypothetical protein SAMN02745673_02040 [Marinactinospora thermotolerans DSM 45154]
MADGVRDVAALRDADPRQLGAFRLQGRLADSPVGVVYLARDRRGRAVSVAMLSRGAAADAAARDRFVAAVTKGAGVASPPRVVAAATSSLSAPWVAVPYAEGGRGAEVFLEPVGAGGASAGGVRLAPYWAGEGGGGAPRWGRLPGRAGSGVVHAEPDRRVVAGLVVLLLLFLVLLVLLYLYLSALGGREPGREQTPQGGGTESAEPSPSPSSSPGDSGEPSPGRPQEEGTQEPRVSPGPSEVPSVPLDDEDVEGMPVEPTDPQDLA